MTISIAGFKNDGRLHDGEHTLPGGGFHFNGVMDEIIQFNRYLSDQEIAQIFEASKTKDRVFTSRTAKRKLMTGQILSPVSWEESDHSFNFDVTNQIISTSIGHESWPMVFGKGRQVKTVLLSRPAIGTLRYNVSTDMKEFEVNDGEDFPQNQDIRLLIGVAVNAASTPEVYASIWIDREPDA
jgi:hypothetical protein